MPSSDKGLSQNVRSLPTTPDGSKYVCTFTDYFTKFVDFYPISNKSAECVAKCIKTFSCRWGAPARLLSDQGREFVNRINDQMCKEFGIKRSITSAYHPQTNELDERTNQTLKQRLSKLVNEHQNNWCDFLEEVAYSIRIQKQATTKYSPFYLMFGRNPNSPQNMAVVEDCSSAPDHLEEELDEEVKEKMANAVATQEQVLSNIEVAQQKQKMQYQKRKTKGVKSFDLKVGDTVYKRQMKNISRKGGKMEPCWIGPYRIDDIDTSQRATLIPLKESALPLKNKVPYDQLRPYCTSRLHDDDDSDNTSSSNNTTPSTSNTSSSTSNTTPSTSNTSSSTSNTTPSTSNTSSTTSNTSSSTSNTSSSTSNTSSTTSNTSSSTAITSTTTNIASTTTNIKKKKRVKGQSEVLQSMPNNNYEQLSVQILQDHFWLTDEHVDHGQWLLSQQFPEARGLHSVLSFEGKPKVEKGLKDFVQIINVGGQHWATVTNIHCEENAVKVYDSLSLNVTKKLKQKFHSCLAALLGTTVSKMFISYPPMQKQKGCDDCGLFALAVAFSLLAGDDPSQLTYDQSCMREHLALCFQVGELGPFPLKNCHVKL
ncbi:probable protein phosphatase DDB_G0282105 [Dendronephthya gigantea]|uniref:probable protein phosphatase DDB_G0282105 n=1 Tax=Dendronephthya gigantea TaxID=151771 RepID=UPI00106C1280|nr:probable protein phosphatase DDB_G0282105 [Dendronephthya gigantea]